MYSIENENMSFNLKTHSFFFFFFFFFIEMHAVCDYQTKLKYFYHMSS